MAPRSRSSRACDRERLRPRGAARSQALPQLPSLRSRDARAVEVEQRADDLIRITEEFFGVENLRVEDALAFVGKWTPNGPPA